jgi:hypothetical protein
MVKVTHVCSRRPGRYLVRQAPAPLRSQRERALLIREAVEDCGIIHTIIMASSEERDLSGWMPPRRTIVGSMLEPS